MLTLSDDDIRNGIEAVSSRYATDTVLDFLFSMNNERFETTWIIPRLETIVLRLEGSERSVASYRNLFVSVDGEFLRSFESFTD